jgi:hypothetical protein
MQTIKLDGREFAGVSQALSANQETYVQAHMRLAGVLEILEDLDGKKRSKERKARELLTQLMLTGKVFNVMAGCLTEVGKKWSREEADRNAERFGEITDTVEKKALIDGIVMAVIGFFQFGEASSETSPKSSNRRAKDRPTANAARKISATTAG